jgi:hypothetical protein
MDIANIDDVELIAISDDSDSEQNFDIGTKGLNKSLKAIFSVVFDLRSGPKIEYQYQKRILFISFLIFRYPEDMNLSGVEFYALASGLHSFDKVDIMYLFTLINIQTQSN